MPTLYKPQMTESATPMLEIWNVIYNGLVPKARQILAAIDYYERYDVPFPDPDSELSAGEKEGLDLILRILMDAAISCGEMPKGVLVATFRKVAKNPSVFFAGGLPADVQWILAQVYQRDDEKPGTYCMDIWGNEQKIPAEANIARAAQAADRRIDSTRAAGRPNNPATQMIADKLGELFRASGQPVVRRRQPCEEYRERLVYIETGLFHDFLELVLPPLQRHLHEHGLAQVTIDSIVRCAIEGHTINNHPIVPTAQRLQTSRAVCDFAEAYPQANAKGSHDRQPKQFNR